MAIQYTVGDILQDLSPAIVIPVNLRGTPGAGLARHWAQRFPESALRYVYACKRKDKFFRMGSVLCLKSSDGFFICFPTKDDWRNASRIEWIDNGLTALKRAVVISKVSSLAVPALGCGLGGLAWNDVKPLIEKHLSGMEILIYVYPPG